MDPWAGQSVDREPWAFYNESVMVKQTATETRLAVAENAMPQWLALKEASDFLGVHFTTLRTWADHGDIPVFRTPGGHRRFSLDDLRRFLAQRSQLAPADEHGIVSVAVGRTREELERQLPLEQRWRYPLQGDAEQARRQRGRQLFALAVSFVVKPGQSERLLEQGRELGREYGWEAARERGWFGGDRQGGPVLSQPACRNRPPSRRRSAAGC